MSWEYQFEARALREVGRLSHTDKVRVFRYLEQRLCNADNPCVYGKPLRRQFSGLWRFRIGDIRMICQVKDDELVILVVKVGHRREVYE